MNVHKNAKLTPTGRAQMIERMLAGEPVQAVAEATGVSGTVRLRLVPDEETDQCSSQQIG